MIWWSSLVSRADSFAFTYMGYTLEKYLRISLPYLTVLLSLAVLLRERERKREKGSAVQTSRTIYSFSYHDDHHLSLSLPISLSFFTNRLVDSYLIRCCCSGWGFPALKIKNRLAFSKQQQKQLLERLFSLASGRLCCCCCLWFSCALTTVTFPT